MFGKIKDCTGILKTTVEDRGVDQPRFLPRARPIVNKANRHKRRLITKDKVLG